MIRLYLITIILLVLPQISILAQEQVIITDDESYTGESSAILDIKSVDKGLLFPRVELTTDLTNPSPVTTPASGLVVYNIGTNQSQGFYIWNSSFWQPMNTYIENINTNSTLSVPGIYLVDAGTSGVTIILPDALTSNKGNIFRIYKTQGDANVTIQTTSNQYIGNASAQVISQTNKGFSTIANYTTSGMYQIIQDNRTSIGGNNEYGEMYEFNATGTILTCGSTYTGWTSANAGISSSNVNYVNHATADRLSVTQSGIYKISVSMGFRSNSTNVVYSGMIYKNGIAQENFMLKRQLSATGDFGSPSLTGLISMNANDYIDLRFSATKESAQMVIEVINLNLFKVSE